MSGPTDEDEIMKLDFSRIQRFSDCIKVFGQRDYFDAGISVSFTPSGVDLCVMTETEEAGLVYATLATLPARPMPASGSEEAAVKAILREYGESLVGPRGCTVYGACICP